MSGEIKMHDRWLKSNLLDMRPYLSKEEASEAAAEIREKVSPATKFTSEERDRLIMAYADACSASEKVEGIKLMVDLSAEGLLDDAAKTLRMVDDLGEKLWELAFNGYYDDKLNWIIPDGD